MSTHEKQTNQPVMKIQFGGCSAAVFLHERKRGDGSTFVATSTVLQRTFLDSQGQFQTTSSFGVHDLPKAILCLQKAFEFCASRRSSQASDDE